MWTYYQSTGVLKQDGVVKGRGYSGDGPAFAEGRNNPEMEHVKGKGPIPRGRWRIGPQHTSENVGPVAMHLTPVGHTAYGRTAFMIHGDNRINDASRGCIILQRALRREIAGSPDRDLEVVR